MEKLTGYFLAMMRGEKLTPELQKLTDFTRAEFRKNVDDTLTDEEIDRIFNNRDDSTSGTSWEDDIYKGVFDD